MTGFSDDVVEMQILIFSLGTKSGIGQLADVQNQNDAILKLTFQFGRCKNVYSLMESLSLTKF